MPELVKRSQRPIKLSRPTTQQISPFQKQQRSESREIAKRVHDRSHSNRLEKMMRRLENQLIDAFLVENDRPINLEYLAIAQRPDQHYQIIIKGSKAIVTGLSFETIKHCTEATAEVEQLFDMSRFQDNPTGETLETIEEIVRGHQWRETVQRSFTVA